MAYDIVIDDSGACKTDPTKIEVVGNKIVVTFSNGSVREDDLPTVELAGYLTTEVFNGHKHTLADITDFDPTVFATSAQGTKADSAVQPGANLSVFTNDLNIPTSTELDTTNNTLNNHVANTSNPHGVTKGQVGLGNVDNTSDANKPISSAQQTEINSKYNAAVSYINSKLAQKVDRIDGSRLMTTAEGDKLAEFDDKHYRKPVADIAALTALSQANLYDRERRYVASEGKDYFYDAAAVAGEEAPTDQTGGTGFWKTPATGTSTASYTKWILSTGGTFRKNMTDESILDLRATGLLEVAYTAEGKVTYSSAKIEQKIDEKIKEETQNNMDQMLTDESWAPGVLYVIPC